jgi:hypothetical protein
MIEVRFNGTEASRLIRRAMHEIPSQPTLWLIPYGEDVYLEYRVAPIDRIEPTSRIGGIEVSEMIPLELGDWMEGLDTGEFFVIIDGPTLEFGTVSEYA